MRLERNSFTVETNTQKNKQQVFGIKDPAVVFDILVTKLYDNPIKIVVQEYMSNARDSHREAGKADLPIEVVLPTQLDPTIKIKDFGVGISPDRMNDVFIFLGESTKNNSNLETGAFGVGAKTAWAYTDSFTIITVYNNIEYVYLAYIGSGKLGTIDLLSEKKTSASNGTTIEVNVEKHDWKEFEKHVYHTSHFWEVRPVIKNSQWITEYISTNEINNNTGERLASVVNNVTDCNYLSYTDRKIMIVLDGIIYRPLNDIEEVKNINIKPSYKTAIFLHFKTGELIPSITRDSIMIENDTINTLTIRKDELVNYIISDFTKNVAAIDNFNDLVNFLLAYDLDRLDMLSTWSFVFNGVTIKYSSKQFTIDIKSDHMYVQVFKYEPADNTLRFSTTGSIINILDIHKGLLIVNDKFTKIVNKNSIKYYCNTANTTRIRDIKVLQPNLWKDKTNYYVTPPSADVVIKENEHLYKFLTEAGAIGSKELLRSYDSAVSKGTLNSTKKSTVLKVRELNHRSSKLMWVNFYDLVDDYQYFINTEDHEYYDSYRYTVRDWNEVFPLKKIKIVKLTKNNVKSLNTDGLGDRIISIRHMNEMIYENVIHQLDTNDLLPMAGQELNLMEVEPLESIYHYIDSIKDPMFKNWLKLHIPFNNKLKKRTKETELGSLFSKVKRNFYNESEYKQDRLMNMKRYMKRKNRSWDKGYTLFKQKYPILFTNSYNYRIDKIHLIDYINAMYIVKETKQLEERI